MSRDAIEIVKDEVWKASVFASRPLTTVRERFADAVFDAIGTEILEEQWDLLVVLDACRADAARIVFDEYDFLETFETTFMKSSSSREFIATNFRDRYQNELARTAYVTGNPFSNDYLHDGDFALLDEVWRYEWDTDRGTIPPDAITDATVRACRNDDYDRTIAHYMQPHFPSLTDPDLGSAVDPETNVWIDSVWDRLEAGDVSRERVWNAYVDNLRHVLDSVEVLLRNVDAETVVVTADHGNGFGEHGIYGHPRLRTRRTLREVPWIVTSATDTGEYEPASTADEVALTDDGVEERLRDLGYR
ncbi:hypothetical protein ACFQJD_08390 [Haloplanus sp. GCM10025708]|uniref:hypothetical protein n=1 Tax=Haloferacaceae TaxID=1644056 RepID=UPI00361DAFDC